MSKYFFVKFYNDCWLWRHFRNWMVFLAFCWIKYMRIKVEKSIQFLVWSSSILSTFELGLIPPAEEYCIQNDYLNDVKVINAIKGTTGLLRSPKFRKQATWPFVRDWHITRCFSLWRRAHVYQAFYISICVWTLPKHHAAFISPPQTVFLKTTLT